MLEVLQPLGAIHYNSKEFSVTYLCQQYLLENKRDEEGVQKVFLPERTKVYIKESEPGWGRQEGITFFVEQNPGTHVIGRRGSPSDSFLGLAHRINPDGSFFPPELRANVEFALRELGWEVEQRLLDLLGIEDSP